MAKVAMTDVIRFNGDFAKTNPKREGTAAHAKFAALQKFNGKPVGDFIAFTKEAKNAIQGEKSWGRGELRWCMRPHNGAPEGFVRLEPAA